MSRPGSALSAGVLACIPVIILAACGPSDSGAGGTDHAMESLSAAVEGTVPDIARGEYLVTIGGCHDCHSPKVMGPNGPDLDVSGLLSGHPAGQVMPAAPAGLTPDGWAAAGNMGGTAWMGPWGTSYAANLTPDPTGMGNWTEAQFVAAMRTGQHAGSGRPILPPMPWQNMAQMTDDDLKSVFAYLRTIPEVANVVPAPAPPPL
jgi:mono/diheme cytochrome c family protein